MVDVKQLGSIWCSVIKPVDIWIQEGINKYDYVIWNETSDVIKKAMLEKKIIILVKSNY